METVPEHLTDRQKKWFDTVQANLEKNTGKTMDEWIAIARTCPETTPKARLKWLKDNHGLMQNSAMQVLSRMDGSQRGWSDPGGLRGALWKDAGSRAIFEAVEAVVLALPSVVVGQRKGYSAWSGEFQFAAMKPVKGGAKLGLAVPPESDPRFVPYAKSDGWSERLKASVVLTSVEQVDAGLRALIGVARGRS